MDLEQSPPVADPGDGLTPDFHWWLWFSDWGWSYICGAL